MPGIRLESMSSERFLVLPDFGAIIPQGFSKSSPIKINPPLGPRRVLCVVEVTI